MDLSALDQTSRSEVLLDRFPAVPHTSNARGKPLWRLIFRDHRNDFLLQWGLTAIESFVMIVPQICLFNILELLQKRNGNDSSPTGIWLYVVLLGISKIVHITLESWYDIAGCHL